MLWSLSEYQDIQIEVTFLNYILYARNTLHDMRSPNSLPQKLSNIDIFLSYVNLVQMGKPSYPVFHLNYHQDQKGYEFS